MYAYYIVNRITGETDLIFGYNFPEACKRYGLNESEWRVEVIEPKETEYDY